MNLSRPFAQSAGAISIESLSVTNAQDISVTGSGAIPLSGSGLNFAANGSAPLAMAEAFLRERGTNVSGLARFDITATGSTSNPQLNGLLSVSGGQLADPLTNLRLNDIGLIAGVSGQQITVRQLNARTPDGGSITGSGTVGLAAGLPADLQIALADFRYGDGATFGLDVFCGCLLFCFSSSFCDAMDEIMALLLLGAACTLVLTTSNG